MNLAVFVSGKGSNLNAILNAPELKGIASVKGVFSDKKECGAFQIANEFSIPIFSISSIEKEGYISYSKLPELLNSLDIELIVLAGFLKLVPEAIVKQYRHRIINIHPALLPSFGGKGMYGMNVHKAVFESSAKVSGATIHFVDEEYDKGKIIAQQCVSIADAVSPDEIAVRVLEVEHQLLPAVIKKLAENKISIINDRVITIN